MGFGLLFIGYFLFLNVTYHSFTDLIAGLITVMAFYKLSTVNKYFKMNIVPSIMFSVFGAFQLFAEFADMFGIGMSDITGYIAAPRFLLIGILSVVMLLGIEDVAKEVDVPETKHHVKIAKPLTYVIFPVCAILEFPAIQNIIPAGLPITVTATVTLIGEFFIIIYNLVTVYSAYMRICMPEDIDNDVTDKPSRFGFVNSFRKHEEERSREYAEYKLQKLKKKAEKKRRK